MGVHPPSLEEGGATVRMNVGEGGEQRGKDERCCLGAQRWSPHPESSFHLNLTCILATGWANTTVKRLHPLYSPVLIGSEALPPVEAPGFILDSSRCRRCRLQAAAAC